MSLLVLRSQPHSIQSMWWVVFLFLVVLCVDEGVHGWTLSLSSTTTTRTFSSAVVRPHASTTTRLALSAKEEEDEDELIARRIVVEGDVQGGYYRSCVLNEAGRFRRLVGTMSAPDDASRQAEIYVEGKRKLVDGFVRWCRRGKVGLSQVTTVLEVMDEEPTGLYEDFYVDTRSS